MFKYINMMCNSNKLCVSKRCICKLYKMITMATNIGQSQSSSNQVHTVSSVN